MNRLTLIATPAVLGLLASGAASAAPADVSPQSGRLPADPSCTMVVDEENSKPGAPKFAIKGTEFTAGAGYSVIGIKQGGGGGPVSPQGTINFGDLEPGNYGVQTKEDGVVLCGHTPKPASKDWRYKQGYNLAFQRISRNCDAMPPGNLQNKHANWQAGYKDGVVDAKAKFCD
ncbi:hypothetical protein DEJ50_10295 [Streptomyces venezuelae]|uniref:Secreted protein n=2 Tax=Streptomyces venezuelae TaxID=54571 RepID=A0A5P2CZ52_STRVZ|nr:hypothetical protein DEJ50_10295 [Streptomyces venezuelae]